MNYIMNMSSTKKYTIQTIPLNIINITLSCPTKSQNSQLSLVRSAGRAGGSKAIVH